MSDPWPTEIRLVKGGGSLDISFDSDDRFELSAEYLRVYSPSAEVQGHAPDQKKTVPGKRDVKILNVEPVGNYAIRIRFDDLHDTGIYSWTYLFKLGREQDALWADYLTELAEKNMTRDP